MSEAIRPAYREAAEALNASSSSLLMTNTTLPNPARIASKTA